MILRRVSLGIPVAGFLAACVIAGQATAGQTENRPPAAESGAQPTAATLHRTLRVRLVESDETSAKKARDNDDENAEEKEKPGAVVVIDSKAIAHDVEETVKDAISEAMDAIGNIKANVRVDVDGKRLKVKSKQYRETLDEARDRLKNLGERLGEHAAEVEVRVIRKRKKGEKAAAGGGEGIKQKRVIVIRDGDKTKIKIEKDKKGRTVVAIEGEDVKVITREKPEQEEDSDKTPE